jgi:cob(I)alamin adenosyltransferase
LTLVSPARDRKVYTRTGDDGTTGLFHGGRVAKDASGPMAYGAVDEAVSALGVARAQTGTGSELDDLLIRLQRELFVVGAELATSPERRNLLEPGVSRVTQEMVDGLEPIIDDLTSRFDAPTEFVVPGQNRLSALLDVARTAVRKAERRALVAAAGDSQVVPYLNRLSDLLWTMARWQEGQFMPARERKQ